MRIAILLLLGTVALFGCGKSENSQETSASAATSMRVEAAKRLIAQSIEALKEQDIADAVKGLKASIEANPDDPTAYILLGQMLLKVQQYDQAAIFLEPAVKKFEDNAVIFYMFAIANYQSNKPLPAALAARHSVELFAKSGDKESAQKAAALLQQIIATADQNTAPKPIGS